MKNKDEKDLFISYDQADSIQAHSIAQSLEQQYYSSWLFEKNEKGGTYYREQTRVAIEKCKAFILLISKASVFSEEVTLEVSDAQKFHIPIFPILYEINWDSAMGANKKFSSILGGKRTAIPLDEADFSRTISALVDGLVSEGIIGSLLPPPVVL